MPFNNNDGDNENDEKDKSTTDSSTGIPKSDSNNNFGIEDDLTTSAQNKLWANIERKHNHPSTSSSSTSSPVRGRQSTTSTASSSTSRMGAVPTAIAPAKDVHNIPEEDVEDDGSAREDSPGVDAKSQEIVYLPPGNDGSSAASTSYNSNNTTRSTGKQKESQAQHLQMQLEGNLGSLKGAASAPRTPSGLGDRHLHPPGSTSRPTSRSRQPTSQYQQQQQQGYGSLGSSTSGYPRRTGSAAPSRSVSRARGFPASDTTSSRGGDDDDDRESTSADEDERERESTGDPENHIQRSVSQAGHRRGGTYPSTFQQHREQQQREKRDKGEELIRQRQIERRKAKRLASARLVSYSQPNNPQGGGYPEEEGGQGGEDVFVQQDQARYGSRHGAGGYSVPSTPMGGGSRSAGMNTPGPERHVSLSGRKRGGAETPGGYFPPFGSIERGGSEWGGATSGGDESGGATPLAGGYPHHQQSGGRSSSQAGYTRQGFQDKARTGGRGSKTPRLGPTTPGLGAGYRMDSPSLGPSAGYAGEDRDLGVGKAASVIEQVVSELGSGEQRDREMREDAGDGDDDDDEDEDDEEVDEEGVTVRDRQDVSGVSTRSEIANIGRVRS